MGGIFSGYNPTSPRRTKPPVLLAEYCEILVVLRGIGKVTNIEKYLVKVLFGPNVIIFGHDGSGINMISVVVVMIVVVT
jgi:hypothetical protein